MIGKIPSANVRQLQLALFAAARQLGIPRETLAYHLKKLHLFQ